MFDLKACTVCFSTQGKLIKIDRGLLGRHFITVSGLKEFERELMPPYLCVECSAYVWKFVKFRDKCKRAHFTLKELHERYTEIKISHLKLLDREKIGNNSSLSYVDLNNVNFFNFKFESTKIRPHTYLAVVPCFHIGTLPCDLDGSENTNITVKEESEEQPELLEIQFEPTCDNEDSESSILKNTLLENSTMENNDTENNYFDDDGENVESLDVVDSENEEENWNEQELDIVEEEYATLVPLSEIEARAALDICRTAIVHKKLIYECNVCEKKFKVQQKLQAHERLHDPNISGNFRCHLCKYYYRTEYLLNVHKVDRHLYKYLCKECPEVSYDRRTAKNHYVTKHFKAKTKDDEDWLGDCPSWLNSHNNTKKIAAKHGFVPAPKKKRLFPADYLTYTPITQEEQYKIVQDRKNSRNYKEAVFRCELCFKGFREAATYEKHMHKHDPKISGNCQCDMCKQYFRSPRHMYKHMHCMHLFRFSCNKCSFVCFNRGQAEGHYKWHMNITYPCPYCDKIFNKISTKLTHVRIKHPSLFICSICGHSFVSENGLYCHIRIAHTEEEKKLSEKLKLQPPDAYYCADCQVQFVSESAYNTHLGSSNKHAETNISVSEKVMSARRAGKRRRNTAGAAAGAGAGAGAGVEAGAGAGAGRPRGRPRAESNIVNTGLVTAHDCDLCGVPLKSDVAARAHYEAEHPGQEMAKRYMCHVCGHATRQYANLLVHMRTHTREKPYACPHCDRTFSMPSNRDRHIVVHTGEKKYQCQHCNRRFTQSSAVKLHIQTVHLKIPYAPWDKKNRKRKRELEGTSAPVSSVLPTTECQPQPKVLIEPQPDYLSAYITYNE